MPISSFNAALLEDVNARDITVRDNQLIAINQLRGDLYLSRRETLAQYPLRADALSEGLDGECQLIDKVTKFPEALRFYYKNNKSLELPLGYKFPLEKINIRLKLVILTEKAKLYKQQTSEELTLLDLFQNVASQSSLTSKKILIMGRPGVGKSVCCQKIAYLWGQEKLFTQYTVDGFDIVYWIPLRYLLELDVSRKAANEEILGEFIYNLLHNENQDTKFVGYITPEIIAAHLRGENPNVTKSLFILDSFDEVQHLYFPDARDRKTLAHKILYELLKQDYIILTSRSHAISPQSAIWQNMDQHYDLMELGLEDISSYVTELYAIMGHTLDEAKSLLSRIEGQPILQGIAQVPITLTLLAMTQIHTREILTINVLYQQIINQLLRKYLSVFCKLDSNKVDVAWSDQEVVDFCAPLLLVLGSLAFKGIKSQRRIFEAESLSRVFDRHKMQLDNFLNELSKEKGEGVPPKRGKKKMLLQHFNKMGLLRAFPYGNKTLYEFLHTSFQRYFAALYLWHCLDEQGESNISILKKFIKLSVYNIDYIETIQLLVEMLVGKQQSQQLDRFLSLLLTIDKGKSIAKISLWAHCLNQSLECKNIANLDGTKELIDALLSDLQGLFKHIEQISFIKSSDAYSYLHEVLTRLSSYEKVIANEQIKSFLQDRIFEDNHIELADYFGRETASKIKLSYIMSQYEKCKARTHEKFPYNKFCRNNQNIKLIIEFCKYYPKKILSLFNDPNFHHSFFESISAGPRDEFRYMLKSLPTSYFFDVLKIIRKAVDYAIDHYVRADYVYVIYQLGRDNPSKFFMLDEAGIDALIDFTFSLYLKYEKCCPGGNGQRGYIEIRFTCDEILKALFENQQHQRILTALISCLQKDNVDKYIIGNTLSHLLILFFSEFELTQSVWIQQPNVDLLLELWFTSERKSLARYVRYNYRKIELTFNDLFSKLFKYQNQDQHILTSLMSYLQKDDKETNEVALNVLTLFLYELQATPIIQINHYDVDLLLKLCFMCEKKCPGGTGSSYRKIRLISIKLLTEQFKQNQHQSILTSLINYIKHSDDIDTVNVYLRLLNVFFSELKEILLTQSSHYGISLNANILGALMLSISDLFSVYSSEIYQILSNLYTVDNKSVLRGSMFAALIDNFEYIPKDIINDISSSLGIGRHIDKVEYTEKVCKTTLSDLLADAYDHYNSLHGLTRQNARIVLSICLDRCYAETSKFIIQSFSQKGSLLDNDYIKLLFQCSYKNEERLWCALREPLDKISSINDVSDNAVSLLDTMLSQEGSHSQALKLSKDRQSLLTPQEEAVNRLFELIDKDICQQHHQTPQNIIELLSVFLKHCYIMTSQYIIQKFITQDTLLDSDYITLLFKCIDNNEEQLWCILGKYLAKMDSLKNFTDNVYRLLHEMLNRDGLHNQSFKPCKVKQPLPLLRENAVNSLLEKISKKPLQTRNIETLLLLEDAGLQQLHMACLSSYLMDDAVNDVDDDICYKSNEKKEELIRRLTLLNPSESMNILAKIELTNSVNLLQTTRFFQTMRMIIPLFPTKVAMLFDEIDIFTLYDYYLFGNEKRRHSKYDFLFFMISELTIDLIKHNHFKPALKVASLLNYSYLDSCVSGIMILHSLFEKKHEEAFSILEKKIPDIREIYERNEKPLKEMFMQSLNKPLNRILMLLRNEALGYSSFGRELRLNILKKYKQSELNDCAESVLFILLDSFNNFSSSECGLKNEVESLFLALDCEKRIILLQKLFETSIRNDEKIRIIKFAHFFGTIDDLDISDIINLQVKAIEYILSPLPLEIILEKYKQLSQPETLLPIIIGKTIKDENSPGTIMKYWSCKVNGNSVEIESRNSKESYSFELEQDQRKCFISIFDPICQGEKVKHKDLIFEEYKDFSYPHVINLYPAPGARNFSQPSNSAYTSLFHHARIPFSMEEEASIEIERECNGHGYSDDEMRVLLEYYLDGHQTLKHIKVLQGTVWRSSNNLRKELFNFNQQHLRYKQEGLLSIKDKVIVPVNLNNNHWALFYIIYQQHGTKLPKAYFFDPLGYGAPEEIRDVLSDKELFPAIELFNIGRRVRNNRYNCCLWVVEATRKIIHGGNVPSEDYDIFTARQDHQRILNNKKHWHSLYEEYKTPQEIIDEFTLVSDSPSY